MLEKSERFLLNCHWFHKTVFFNRIACSLANYDDSLTFMNRIVTSIWIRIDDQPNVRHTKPLRYMVLFSHEWRASLGRHQCKTWSTPIRKNEGNKYEWIFIPIPWPFQCFTFNFGTVWSLRFPFFRTFDTTTLVLADSLFNYYYQISAPMLRVELWNLATKKKTIQLFEVCFIIGRLLFIRYSSCGGIFFVMSKFGETYKSSWPNSSKTQKKEFMFNLIHIR